MKKNSQQPNSENQEDSDNSENQEDSDKNPNNLENKLLNNDKEKKDEEKKGLAHYIPYIGNAVIVAKEMYRDYKANPGLFKETWDEMKRDKRGIYALCWDAGGVLTQIAPVVGDYIDIAYCLIQRDILLSTYNAELSERQKKLIGTISILEEGIPGYSEWFPSGCFAHFIAAYNRALKKGAIDAEYTVKNTPNKQANKQEMPDKETEDPYADTAAYLNNSAPKQLCTPKEGGADKLLGRTEDADDEDPYKEMEYRH